ncbi:hypothetical protein GCM10009744_31200 [Kribbella alba]|uniref:Uncharacterized protein n=1 Tax=Kribbella alba TaxID=190197 RepID=A0ABP4R7K4_9ACTN
MSSVSALSCGLRPLPIATKVYFKMHDGPGGSGLSRKAIMEQIDATTRRGRYDHRFLVPAFTYRAVP